MHVPVPDDLDDDKSYGGEENCDHNYTDNDDHNYDDDDDDDDNDDVDDGDVDYAAKVTRRPT